MNQTIDIMNSHRSIRNYLDKDIPDEMLNTILAATQTMPTAFNGQQVSLIVVKNPEMRKRLATLCDNQPWVEQAPVFIIFVADFYKTHLACEINNIEQLIHESAEGTVLSVLDCGIALGGMIVAAESLGLGVVAIGGLRKNAKEVARLLKLPKYTFPVNGFCLGYAKDQSKQKPRLPLDTFVHHEEYKTDHLRKQIKQYDKEMEDYLPTVGREIEGNWSKKTSDVYQRVYYPNVKQDLLDQGFLYNT